MAGKPKPRVISSKTTVIPPPPTRPPSAAAVKPRSDSDRDALPTIATRSTDDGTEVIASNYRICRSIEKSQEKQVPKGQVAAAGTGTEEKDEEAIKKNHCWRRWCVVVLLILFFAGGGILLWQLLPEEAKAQGTALVESTSGAAKVDLSKGPDLSYQFNKCPSGATDCCNGLTTTCDLRVNEVLWAGVHNSMATLQDGFRIAPNHIFQLEYALQAGYRNLNMDLCNCNGVFKFAHGKCYLGQRDALLVMTKVNDFLTENPTEVILITFQVNNGAGEVVNMWDFYNQILVQIPGMTDRMYNHGINSDAAWPTFRQLKQAGKQILFFHYGATTTCFDSQDCPPGFHDWFLYAQETRYSFADIAQIQNQTNSCEVTRGYSGYLNFFGLNVFVTLPDEEAAAKINSKDFMNEQIDACSKLNYDQTVNILLVDFWHEGDLPLVVQTRNDALGRVRIAELLTSSSSSNTSSSGATTSTTTSSMTNQGKNVSIAQDAETASSNFTEMNNTDGNSTAVKSASYYEVTKSSSFPPPPPPPVEHNIYLKRWLRGGGKSWNLW